MEGPARNVVTLKDGRSPSEGGYLERWKVPSEGGDLEKMQLQRNRGWFLMTAGGPVRATASSFIRPRVAWRAAVGRYVRWLEGLFRLAVS